MSVKTLFHPGEWESGTRKRLLLAIAVVFVVLGWRWVVHASGRRLRNIGKELVAVNMLVKYPVPNWAGTQVLFAQSTELGVGVYVLNLATGQRQTIYELAEGRILSGSLLLLDWAPDDSMLAYARPIKGKKQEVVLCSSSIGKKVGGLTVVGLIKEFRWLSPASFAYLNDSNDIYVAERDAHGKWLQTHEFKGVTTPPVTHFAAMSTRELGWKQSGAVWTLDISSGVPEQLWKPQTNRLISCYFSGETGNFVVSAQNKDGSFQILSLNPATKSASVLNRLTQPNISKVNWVNSGQGFAFQCADHWEDSLILRRTASAQAVDLFTDGQVIDFKARRDRVFIYGSAGNEPPGIWEYTIGTGATKCLVASTERPFSFARTVNHSSGTLTNGDRIITYQVWSPAPMRKGKAYPLILGQTPYRWNAYPFVAATAGYQFVTVNRKSWDEGLERWEEDVMAVRAEFANRLNVDLKRVYLYGHSAETVPISNLAASRPDWWKGVIILSPTELPDLSRCRLSTMLIDAAELDSGAPARLTAYQAEAAKGGVAVKLVLHPHARHTSWSRATEQDKVAELAEFLAAN